MVKPPNDGNNADDYLMERINFHLQGCLPDCLQKHLQHYRLIQEFTSKKNRVFLLRRKTVDSRDGSQDSSESDFRENFLKGREEYILKERESGYREEADNPGSREEVHILNFREEEYTLDFREEGDILERLRKGGVRVPALFFSGEGFLLMEYIPGPTLLDCLCLLEEEEAPPSRVLSVFSRLADWLEDFYSSPGGKGIILGDVNFRNFILYGQDSISGNGSITGQDSISGKGSKSGQDNEGVVYRVDFENCRPGPVEEDIGRLCAFGLTYSPVFTDWKREAYKMVFRRLVERLELDPGLTHFYLRDELEAIIKRRGCSLPGRASFLREIIGG